MVTARTAASLARALIGLAGFAVLGTAEARDTVAGAVLGAGAGAIIAHAVGGPDAAVVGGVIGAAAGAAVASGGGHGVAVHYRGGHPGYAPPVHHHRRPREPVFVLPPSPIVVVPSRGHGYWHHDIDPWGRPVRTWVPAPAPRYYAPPPRPYHHHPRHRQRHGPRW